MTTRPFIETRTTLLGCATDEQHRRWTQQMLARNGLPIVADWTVSGPAVLARVNHGRWLADCEVCGGAEMVDPDWPVFVCCSCGDGPRPVAFALVREQIEAELLRRPDSHNRNWEPGETVAALRRENRERGMP